MTVLLQISDTHFGTEQPPVIDALLRLAREQAPDVAILSGDITQRARIAQFRAARRFIESLAVQPTLVLPGNHDIPLFDLARRVFAPYSRHRRVFGTDLEPSFESPELLIVCVNTTRPYRHASGAVSQAQIERVVERLNSATPAQLRVVVTHQPVHVITARDRDNLLRGHAAAVRAWAAAGADLVLGGHIHLPYARPLRESFGDLPHPLWVVQAGSALSWRVRHCAPNSVNLIRYEAASGPRRCVVEQWDYHAPQLNFEMVARTPIVFDDTVESIAV